MNGRSIALDSGRSRCLEIWWRLYLNYSDLYHRLLVAGICALLRRSVKCFSNVSYQSYHLAKCRGHPSVGALSDATRGAHGRTPLHKLPTGDKFFRTLPHRKILFNRGTLQLIRCSKQFAAAQRDSRYGILGHADM